MAKATGKKKTSNKQNKKQNEEQIIKTQRTTNILLFSISLLLLSLCFIKGGGAWEWFRNFNFGIFGVGMFLLPLLMITIAVFSELKKNKYPYLTIFEAVVLVVLLCAAINIFKFKAPLEFGNNIVLAYKEFSQGIKFCSGVIGAFFGGLILFITGGTKAAAIAIILILIFLFVMLITGASLADLIKAVRTPVTKVNDERIERRRIREQEYVLNDISNQVENSDKNENIDLVKGDIFKIADEQDKIEDLTGVSAVNADIISKPLTDDEINEVEDDTPMYVQGDILEDILNGTSSLKNDELTEKILTQEDSEQFSNVVEDKDDVKSIHADDEINFDIEPTKIKAYMKPPSSLLQLPKLEKNMASESELRQTASNIVSTLKSFGVETTVVGISRGPSVTSYELQPASGVKVNRITNLKNDIALHLAASTVRIEAPIPGKAAVGIEVPNISRSSVSLRELIDNDSFKNAKSKTFVALGKDISGNAVCFDIGKMPHLLVAGTTGSGKSVCMNSMILSILFNATPDEVQLILIDPKKVEFNVYVGIPHLRVPVISDPRKASGALNWAVKEMMERYKAFSENGVRDINGFNKLAEKKDSELEKMPRIVIFIDELSDLMMAAPKEVEDSICRIAQLARAAGMHLVIATQRPSVDVITGLIKSNIPSRIALKCSSQIDSRTILDGSGAEDLLGNGDLLFLPVGKSKPQRIQGCFVSDGEVEKVIDFIKKQGETKYDNDAIEEIEKRATEVAGGTKTSDNNGEETDERLDEAIDVVIDAQKASTTLLQRKLGVGYARGAKLMDELEARHIIGPYEGAKPRKVLLTKQQYVEMKALSQSPPPSSNIEE